MHCHYCDGKGSPQEMFEKANRLGFVSVGFSSHAPLPFDNDFCMHDDKLDAYIEEISALKGHAETQVYLGLELDFIPGVTTPSHKRWEGLPLDYKIGSVHTLEAPNDRHPMLSVDGPHDEFLVLLNEVHGGSARSMITKYYQRVTELCELGGFDILGHFDLIKNTTRLWGFSMSQRIGTKNLHLMPWMRLHNPV
ncbi:histidinol-phosphatase [Vibrio variabilis]|uniref:Histidinol-phosphatase n=1 Tax=Vibrio variabilis TaxID=990271 RepID=A0ABQ0JJU1_9VIBR|nr:histidinol-phosphatase [Vibrio variabilis]